MFLVSVASQSSTGLFTTNTDVFVLICRNVQVKQGPLSYQLQVNIMCGALQLRDKEGIVPCNYFGPNFRLRHKLVQILPSHHFLTCKQDTNQPLQDSSHLSFACSGEKLKV